MDIKIEKANNNDINDILILLNEVLEIHHTIRPDIFNSGKTKYSSEELIEIINNKLTPVFVAKDNDKLLGYAFLEIKITKDIPYLCDNLSIYIDDLCIKKEYRKNGIGKLLFNYVKDYAKSINANSITLNVWYGNDLAIKFYNDLGMKPLKTTMEYKL